VPSRSPRPRDLKIAENDREMVALLLRRPAREPRSLSGSNLSGRRGDPETSLVRPRAEKREEFRYNVADSPVTSVSKSSISKGSRIPGVQRLTNIDVTISAGSIHRSEERGESGLTCAGRVDRKFGVRGCRRSTEGNE